MVLPGEVLAALMVGGFYLQGGVGDAEPVPQHVAGVVQDLMVVRLRPCHHVHDLHMWALTSGMNVATAHLVARPQADHHEVLDNARDVLRDRFSITHATLQVEPADHAGCEDLTW